MVGRQTEIGPREAGLVLVDGVPLLHPEPQVFDAMLQGWRNQMLARNGSLIYAQCSTGPDLPCAAIRCRCGGSVST